MLKVTKPVRSRRAARSRCAVYDCGACELYREEKCPGCASGNLRLMRDGDDACPVYECVRILGISGCHECARQRCRLGRGVSLKCQLRSKLGGERPSQLFIRKLEGARATATSKAERIPNRFGERLRQYLGALVEYERQEMRVISSHQLARNVGVRASLVRRDLAELGGLGTPGRGYEVTRLSAAIREALDLAKGRSALWVGLSGPVDWRRVMDSLRAANCTLVGVFDDAAPGRATEKLAVLPLSRAPAEARRTGATVAVVASEQGARRELLERLVDAGVRGIVNLTPLRLDLTPSVVVEQCDLGSEVVKLVSRLGG